MGNAADSALHSNKSATAKMTDMSDCLMVEIFQEVSVVGLVGWISFQKSWSSDLTLGSYHVLFIPFRNPWIDHVGQFVVVAPCFVFRKLVIGIKEQLGRMLAVFKCVVLVES